MGNKGQEEVWEVLHRRETIGPMGNGNTRERRAGYNFKDLSCAPTYLNPPISQFVHINSYEI